MRITVVYPQSFLRIWIEQFNRMGIQIQLLQKCGSRSNFKKPQSQTKMNRVQNTDEDNDNTFF